MTEPACSTFRPSPGGGHRWCDTCGWQSEHHIAPTEGQTSLFDDLITAPTSGDLPDSTTNRSDP